MWICPKCERTLRNKNSWHNCVKRDLDAPFAGKHPDLILIFDRILAPVMEWPNVAVSATQNCIIFVHRQTFLIIKPMKSQIEVRWYMPESVGGSFIKSCVWHRNKYEITARFTHEDQISPEVISHIYKSFSLL